MRTDFAADGRSGSSADEPLDVADTTTLGRHVQRVLEEQLLTGHLLPGTKVSLRGLASELGTSMQPVREAVGRLVAARALEFASSRLIRVATLDARQASDLWAMRLLLEGEACAQFAERRAGEEARDLFAHTERMRALDFGADLHSTMAALLEWNRALAQGAASPLLVDTITELRVRYAPTVALALSQPQEFDPAFRAFTLHIQDELIMAIMAGDAASARHLRCADLRSFQRYLFERLGWPRQA